MIVELSQVSAALQGTWHYRSEGIHVTYDFSGRLCIMNGLARGYYRLEGAGRAVLLIMPEEQVLITSIDKDSMQWEKHAERYTLTRS